MLLALRSNRNKISRDDLDIILSRMLVGYQSSENNYYPNTLPIDSQTISTHNLTFTDVYNLFISNKSFYKTELKNYKDLKIRDFLKFIKIK